MSLRQRLRTLKLSMSDAAQNLDDRASKKRAVRHLLIFDHGILRSVWRNFSQIAPDVYRANQPSPEWLVRYYRQGIKTIINLRGVSKSPHYLLEERQAKMLGLTLLSVQGLTARAAPSREDLLTLLDVMRSAEKPMLMHCKSGADRTSLAAAVYLLAQCSATLEQARKQLSPRFIHFKWTKTGVLDHILDTYAAEHSKTGIGFEDWLRTAYDGAAIQASFDASRR